MRILALVLCAIALARFARAVQPPEGDLVHHRILASNDFREFGEVAPPALGRIVRVP